MTPRKWIRVLAAANAIVGVATIAALSIALSLPPKIHRIEREIVTIHHEYVILKLAIKGVMPGSGNTTKGNGLSAPPSAVIEGGAPLIHQGKG